MIFLLHKHGVPKLWVEGGCPTLDVIAGCHRCDGDWNEDHLVITVVIIVKINGGENNLDVFASMLVFTTLLTNIRFIIKR